MKEIEEQVFRIIGKYSKTFLAKELNISKPTLDRRIEIGGWLIKEVKIIEQLSK